MWVGIILALIGVALSVYSTHHHLELKAAGATDAACNINATFNCDEVAKSQFSEIAGIPLGVFGLGYFVANLVLIGFALGGGKAAREHLYGYVGMVLIGLVVSVVMGVISITQVGAACLTCIGIYVTTLVQAGALFAFRREIPPGINTKDTFSGGTTAAIAVAAVVALFTFVKPSITPKPDSNEADKGPVDPNAPQLSLKAEEIKVTRSAYAGLGEDYRKGPDTAKVVLVEFADFQCPACGQLKNTLNQLEAEYGDKIQVVYRNFPLDNSCNSSVQQKMHEFSCKAAVMARCAGQYGKFWALHGTLFDKQREMSEDKIKAWSKEAGLTDEQINQCWDNKDLLAKVKDDVAEGIRLNIDSTPTLYINGRKVVGGRGINDLRASIDQQMQ
jgi:protein-disulfide isomerase